MLHIFEFGKLSATVKLQSCYCTFMKYVIKCNTVLSPSWFSIIICNHLQKVEGFQDTSGDGNNHGRETHCFNLQAKRSKSDRTIQVLLRLNTKFDRNSLFWRKWI
jgi:hypothetical protein